ncbi:hypothetical protein Dsin_013627 [Dipteronia sinensis]|uniref:Reverse transcriptase domain-containing protein n=1 Tax=Dipteronia sinensis TaxID=43782 RepID=A0AAE0ALG4_9ROSI|nr:hypothetical protein Dsin_013627 [Dipteronia sinensis]
MVGFCNVYADSIESSRNILWNDIVSILNSFPLSWVVGGDFNSVLDPLERIGVSSNLGSIRNFNSFVLRAKIFDIPLQGMEFTWSNFRDTVAWSRLDRFLISPVLLSRIPQLRQRGLPRSVSDHNPIVMDTPKIDWGPSPFHFFNVWREDKKMMDDVRSGWKIFNRSVSGILSARMKMVKYRMKRWHSLHKTDTFSWKSYEERMANIDMKAMSKGWDVNLRNERVELLKEAWIGSKKEEQMEAWIRSRKEEQTWRQKSRVKWLKEGDRNSKFFHFVANGRKRSNFIGDLYFNSVHMTDPRLIKEEAAELELIKGEDFGGKDVHITHLQFADDTILFIKPEMEYVMNIKRIFKCFELASGLKVNFHKFGVARVGYKVHMNSLWATALKCKAVSLPISYLGFPLGARPGSKVFWNTLVEKIETRLAPWKRRFLSKSGKLVLIKYVISSILIYFMSVFRISVGIAQRIEKLQRSFLCGDGGVKRKIHALKWDEVRRSKNKGGLGIGKVAVKNKGMLAKWVWRFSNEGKALWKRVIVARYGLDSGSLYWNWKGTHHPSFFTKAIASLYKENNRAVWMLKQGTKVIIGDEARASFWKDISIESSDLQESFPCIYVLATLKEGVVADFGQWEGEEWKWSIPLRRKVFGWEQSQ